MDKHGEAEKFLKDYVERNPDSGSLACSRLAPGEVYWSVDKHEHVGDLYDQAMVILEPELRLINSITIQQFVRYVLVSIDDRFFKTPCSFTGKHHNIGGLGPEMRLDHIRRCARLVVHFNRLLGGDTESLDIQLAAAFLHDIMAGHPDWDKTNPFHAQLAADYLLELPKEFKSMTHPQVDLEIEPEIVGWISEAVRYHMSWWGTERWHGLLGSIFEGEEAVNVLVVAMADYLSTRRDVLVQLDV